MILHSVAGKPSDLGWPELWWLHYITSQGWVGIPKDPCARLDDAGFKKCLCGIFWCVLMNLSRNSQAGWEEVESRAGDGMNVHGARRLRARALEAGRPYYLPAVGFRFCTVKWDHRDTEVLTTAAVITQLLQSNPLESIKLHCPHSGF